MRHEAFFYSSDEEFAATLAPFLADAVTSGEAAIAVATPERIELLRGRLGAKADAVTFIEAGRWYSRPGAALVAWREAIDERLRAGAPSVRAVGKAVEFETDAGAAARWARYESLLNRAFADLPAWIVCPYDARALPEEILADGRRTHPVIATEAGRKPSPEHFEGRELGAPLSPAREQGELAELTGSVVWPARRAGLPGDVIGDLVLAISVLAEGSPATVRAGRLDGEWVCELELGGVVVPDSLGLVIARAICDRVELAEREDGALVRFVFGRPRPRPAQRILAAASELFHRDGVRGTGVNAVIERADVAKATFYAQFASKDELVLAWLRSPQARWLDAVLVELEARIESPAERLTAFFDVLGESLAADGFRGCPFVNTMAEFGAPDHPARHALAEYLAEIEEFFRRNAADAGLSDPEAVAAELTLLVPGTITAVTASRSVEPAAAARRAAAALRTDR